MSAERTGFSGDGPAGGARRLYLARDAAGAPVYVMNEVLPPGVADDDPAASYRHAHLPTVQAVLSDGGGAGRSLLLQPPAGESLGRRLARGPLPPELALNLGVQLAAALAFLHSRALPYVLGRLSPDQIFLQGDQAVLDFTGLSLPSRRRGATGAGVAPEAAQGRPCPQSDVYSLAALLQDLLASPTGAMAPGLQADLQQALHPDPGQRPTAARFQAALARAAAARARPPARAGQAGAGTHPVRAAPPRRVTPVPRAMPGSGPATTAVPQLPKPGLAAPLAKPSPAATTGRPRPAARRAKVAGAALPVAGFLALVLLATGRLAAPAAPPAHEHPPAQAPLPSQPSEHFSHAHPPYDAALPAAHPAEQPPPEPAVAPAAEPTLLPEWAEMSEAPVLPAVPDLPEWSEVPSADATAPAEAAPLPLTGWIDGPPRVPAGSGADYFLTVTTAAGEPVTPGDVLWTTVSDPWWGFVGGPGRLEARHEGQVVIRAVARVGGREFAVERRINVIPAR